MPLNTAFAVSLGAGGRALVTRVVVAKTPISRDYVRIALLEGAVLAVPVNVTDTNRYDRAPWGMIVGPGRLRTERHGNDE